MSNKIDNTVIKVLNPEHGKKVIEWLKSKGVEDCPVFLPDMSYKYWGVIDGVFDRCSEIHVLRSKKTKVIELPNEESKAYEKQSEGFEQIKSPAYYDNSKGSLYQFADNHGLNAYEFDIVKRIVRSRKKGNFKEDLEKTKTLIDLYLLEYEEINRLA